MPRLLRGIARTAAVAARRQAQDPGVLTDAKFEQQKAHLLDG
jgi:hypothetical protein